MKIAYVISAERGETNTLLSQTAEVLAQAGYRLCGAVQTDTVTTRSHLCDMDVVILPDGPVLRISQDLGPNAKGCRLDASALETSVALTLENVRKGADLLIVNKFGKQEADGRGFRDAIAEALTRDIPVLVGVNETNRPALESFCGGEITALDPTLNAIQGWVSTVKAKPV